MQQVNIVGEAERWRYQVIQEASRLISQIQSPGLAEHHIRTLNDQINRLLREKRAWEYHIKNIGGPDYTRSAPIALSDGKEIPGNRGYRYFGQAKNLPGIKELLEPGKAHQEEMKGVRKRLALLQERCDSAYFGMDDEEDGTLLAFEMQAEKEAFGGTEAWQKAMALYSMPIEQPVVPSREELEQWILQQRKEDLLKRFAE